MLNAGIVKDSRRYRCEHFTSIFLQVGINLHLENNIPSEYDMSTSANMTDVETDICKYIMRTGIQCGAISPYGTKCARHKKMLNDHVLCKVCAIKFTVAFGGICTDCKSRGFTKDNYTNRCEFVSVDGKRCKNTVDDCPRESHKKTVATLAADVCD